MSFGDLNLKLSYSTPEDDIIRDFYIPVLKETILYQRATAYFSSLSLLDLGKGIKGLVENDGQIQLIISPEISVEDAKAISEGYASRKEKQRIVDQALSSTFKSPENKKEEEQYNILSHLIEDGVLDVKVAVMKNSNSNGIFHDKIGILQDKNGNLISFAGSMNETQNGMKNNHENIDVYSSLGNDSQRTWDKRFKFEKYWNNNDPTIEVFEFPEDLKIKINQYYKPEVDWEAAFPFATQLKKSLSKKPEIPDSIKLFDYQKEAVNKWKENGFRGIFDMATGTGKTITALASIVEICRSVSDLAIIIVVPYTHLVTQWARDLDRFGIRATQGFSSPSTRRWKSEFKKEISLLNLKLRDYICLITTNASFRAKNVQDMINSIQGEKLLIVDEAHNFGAPLLIEKLDDRFKYRLALSATLERKYDVTGTDFLEEYFSPVCIKYSLSQAILDGRLCSYYYYPIPVSLTEYELTEYEDLSRRISKLLVRNKDGSPKKDRSGNIKFRPEAKMLLIKRARIIAGALNKLEALKKVMKKIDSPKHTLVYCGSTTVDSTGMKFEDADESELKQVDAATLVLRTDFGLKTAQYTSNETSDERKIIQSEFDQGEIDCLIAIRCLDEGVDIPSTDKAVFLASSTNPKEYIQRRGRILRKYPGKSTAIIYDLVTLPNDLDSELSIPGEYDLGLVKREVTRIEDFANDAINKSDANALIRKLEDIYGYSQVHGIQEGNNVDII